MLCASGVVKLGLVSADHTRAVRKALGLLPSPCRIQIIRLRTLTVLQFMEEWDFMDRR